MKPDPVTDLVQSRALTHGKFSDHARTTQRLKSVILDEIEARKKRGQKALTDQQRESLEMIVHKIGRIVAGDAAFADHWDDIAGYARIANAEF